MQLSSLTCRGRSFLRWGCSSLEHTRDIKTHSVCECNDGKCSNVQTDPSPRGDGARSVPHFLFSPGVGTLMLMLMLMLMLTRPVPHTLLFLILLL